MVKRTQFFALLLLLSIALLGILASQGCQPSAEQAKAQKETKDEAALPPEAVEHFRQAHKFLAEQKMDEAFKEFQETARLAPKAPLAQFWLGQAHFLKKDKDQAEKIFLKVLELDPDNYHSMEIRKIVFHGQGQGRPGGRIFEEGPEAITRLPGGSF